MDRPVLYVFAISHYCEKARWALDYLGIDHTLRFLPPGAHMEIAKELGAAGSSLPLLKIGEVVVQGSSAIIDWAEAERGSGANRLSPDQAFEDECRSIEQRLDDAAGVHVRRYYYSEALVEHPDTVRPIFTRDLAGAERASLEENWPIVRQLMMGAMDLGREQGLASREIVEGELDWLDGLLGDGRLFLVGDRLSRADITAASLFAPLALPKEHPTYGAIQIPPRAQQDLERWRDRPTITWVGETYRAFRNG